MHKLMFALTTALVCVGNIEQAQSASTTLAFNFTAVVVVSSNVGCPVAYPGGQNSFTTPVPPGTKIATCAVTPSGWTGRIDLSGADAGFFVMSGNDIVVGATAITAPRTYNVTATSTP